MDDPFGDDPNNFNVEAAARSAFEDIKVLIEDVDGVSGKRELLKAFEEEDMNERLINELEDHRAVRDSSTVHTQNTEQQEDEATVIDASSESTILDDMLGDLRNHQLSNVANFPGTNPSDSGDISLNSFQITDNSSITSKDDDSSSFLFEGKRGATFNSGKIKLPTSSQSFQQVASIDNTNTLPSELPLDAFKSDAHSLPGDEKGLSKSRKMYMRLNPKNLVSKVRKKKNP
eukprot:822942_1